MMNLFIFEKFVEQKIETEWKKKLKKKLKIND